MLKTPADPVDVGLLSAQGSRFTCHYSVPELSRLVAGLAGRSGQVEAQFGFHEVQGFPALEGALAAQVEVICQRCLEVFLLPLAAELKLAFVGREEDEAEVPADFEAVVLQDWRLSLRDLVEDELLLSFPLVPMHPVGSSACRPAVKVLSEEEAVGLPVEPVVEEVKANPFAGLKNMLKRED
jgi:uncharacterized protein